MSGPLKTAWKNASLFLGEGGGVRYQFIASQFQIHSSLPDL